MKLVITVEEIKGSCPAYKQGDRIVLDNGYRFNLQETTAACMHSLCSMAPFYNAFAKGIPPERMGLAHREHKDGKAWIQCPDACEYTGGGTAIFSLSREE